MVKFCLFRSRLVIGVALLTGACFLVQPIYLLKSYSRTHQAAKIKSETKAYSNGSEMFSMDLNNITALLQKAKEIHRETGVVLFTMINDAFLDFAASWCCNTAKFGDVHRHVLFLATDVPTARRLKSLWPTVTVAAINMSQFRGSMKYSTANYVRLMVERTHFILHLLEAGIRVLLFEVDSVWLKNPLPLVKDRQSEGDILATRIASGSATAGGFLLLNPTAATVKLWQKLTDMMDQLHQKIQQYNKRDKVLTGTNDQTFLSGLTKSKFAGIKRVFLPAELFPDGKWYKLPEKQRQALQPFLINNNWIVGTKAKRQRAIDFGHWFWDEDKKQCTSMSTEKTTR